MASDLPVEQGEARQAGETSLPLDQASLGDVTYLGG